MIDPVAYVSSHEGRKNVLYKDSLGYWTIGVGHLLEPSKGGRLSNAAIDFILKEDISIVESQLSNISWWDTASQSVQVALIDMCFQLGFRGLLNFEHMLNCLETKDYAGAAKELKQSALYKETPKRCEDNIALFKD